MLRACERTLAMAAHPLRLAIVGDVHDDLNAIQDAKALQFLEPDLVLFTGDFGEENVELVQDISNLNFPKAVFNLDPVKGREMVSRHSWICLARHMWDIVDWILRN